MCPSLITGFIKPGPVCAGANVHAVDTYGRQPLHHAALNENAEAAAAAVAALVAAGADVQVADHFGRRPLHCAVENQEFRVATAAARALVAAGAYKLETDGNGHTPRQVAMDYWVPRLDDLGFRKW